MEYAYDDYNCSIKIDLVAVEMASYSAMSL